MRYILIDNTSGYIFGDTAALPAHTFDGEQFPVTQDDITPIRAARWLDETETKEYGRTYEDVGRYGLASNETGYRVFRADINGSEAIGDIWDGQDQDTIEAVERDCEFVTCIRCGGDGA